MKRYDRDGDNNGIGLAGGDGQGADINQLNGPTYLFVDAQASGALRERSTTRNDDCRWKWKRIRSESITLCRRFII